MVAWAEARRGPVPPDRRTAVLVWARKYGGALTTYEVGFACQAYDYAAEGGEELAREMVAAGLLDFTEPGRLVMTEAGREAASVVPPPGPVPEPPRSWRPAGDPAAWAGAVADFLGRHGLPQVAALFRHWADRFPVVKGTHRASYLSHTGGLTGHLERLGMDVAPQHERQWQEAGLRWKKAGEAAALAALAASCPLGLPTKRTTEDVLVGRLEDPVAAAALADLYEERGQAGAAAAVRAADWVRAVARLAEANAGHRKGRLTRAELLHACRVAWEGDAAGCVKARRVYGHKADEARGVSAGWVRGRWPWGDEPQRKVSAPRVTLALAVRVGDRLALDVAVANVGTSYSRVMDPAEGWPDELAAEPRVESEADRRTLRSRQARWWRRLREWAERRLSA